MKHKAKIRKGSPRQKQDGWVNVSTRFGVYGRDKRLGSYFEAELIDQETALEIWRGDDFGGRVIELLPQEMTREGWNIQIKEDQDASEKVDFAGRAFAVEKQFELGLCYGRALGGGGLLMLVDDGVADLSVPMREKNIKTFKGMNLLTPRELIPARWYTVPTEPKYGEVALYHVVPVNAPPGAIVTEFPLVHESRVIRFSGTVTTARARFARAMHLGWDDSLFTRIRQRLADFQAATQGTNILLQDFAPAVFKALKLAELLSASKSGSKTLNVNDRVSALEFGSSNAKVKVIDSKEEYKRESVSVAGLPDLLEQNALWLAGAVGVPVSLLMGQAPSGLNATGDSDIRWFYDHVAAFQRKKLYEELRRFYTIVMLAKDGPTRGKLPDNWDILFNPLWQETPAEVEKRRLDVASRDALYIQNQVLTPEEVARERFGGDTYNAETHIDLEERQALMEAQAEREAAATAAGREADPAGPAAQQATAAKEPQETTAKNEPPPKNADA